MFDSLDGPGKLLTLIGEFYGLINRVFGLHGDSFYIDRLKNNTAMKKLFLFLGIIIVIYFIVKVGGSGLTHTPTSSTIPQKTHTLQGFTPTVKKVQLNKGVAIFSLAVDSDKHQHIDVKVIDPGKSDGYHIINETGKTYKGSTTYSVKTSGTHIIEVNLQGDWKLEIE